MPPPLMVFSLMLILSLTAFSINPSIYFIDQNGKKKSKLDKSKFRPSINDFENIFKRNYFTNFRFSL